MRSSKDLAKRLRFDLFPRPDFFRRNYWIVGLALAGLGLIAWIALSVTVGPRQYLPGPVSQSHATFGDQCETCHPAFQSVRDDACLGCHGTRVHSEFETHTPACRDCHVEHRSREVFLAVSNRACTDCHGDLDTTRPEPAIHETLGSFSDHPPFTPLREGKRDDAAIRFNHRLHLTSDEIAEEDQLDCTSCHRTRADGRRMEPILFERHCQECHPQEVKGPLGSIEVPHEEPAVVREALEGKLLAVAVSNSRSIFEARETLLPGVREREPIDSSKTLRAYRDRWLSKAEEELYEPLATGQKVDAVGRTVRAEKPLLEDNKLCFLCHVRGAEKNDRAIAALASTDIPERWLERADFSHRAHELVDCESCHSGIRQSRLTSDTNLPGRTTCRSCHAGEIRQSAGTDCMLCHLYHDTSKDPAIRRSRLQELTIDELVTR